MGLVTLRECPEAYNELLGVSTSLFGLHYFFIFPAFGRFTLERNRNVIRTLSLLPPSKTLGLPSSGMYYAFMGCERAAVAHAFQVPIISFRLVHSSRTIWGYHCSPRSRSIKWYHCWASLQATHLFTFIFMHFSQWNRVYLKTHWLIHVST